MANFEPTGVEPRWKLIYQLVERLPVGGVVTYEELSQELGVNFRADRGGLERALQEIHSKLQRTLVNERGVGYRVARANEHARLAAAHHKRSRRQLTKAIGEATSARRDELTPAEAQRIDTMEQSLRRQADMVRRLDGRVARTEKGLQEVRREQQTDSAEQSDRLDRLEAAMRRAGIIAPVD